MAKIQCDCGWQFPRRFRLNAKVRDEADMPQDVTIKLECPHCGMDWQVKCPLKFVEQALAV